MFVVIYTPGTAWLEGKSLTEQPFYREHGRYMQRFFADKRLIMGGPFLDNQGAWAFSMSRTKHRRAKYSNKIPPCWRGYFNPICIPGIRYSISIRLRALNQESDAIWVYEARASLPRPDLAQ